MPSILRAAHLPFRALLYNDDDDDDGNDNDNEDNDDDNNDDDDNNAFYIASLKTRLFLGSQEAKNSYICLIKVPDIRSQVCVTGRRSGHQSNRTITIKTNCYGIDDVCLESSTRSFY